MVSPGTRSGLGLLQDPFFSAPLLLGLTHIEDVQGQPVEKGVADQLGKKQTERELYHTLGSTRETQSSGGPPGGQHYPMTSIIPTPQIYTPILTAAMCLRLHVMSR